MELRPARAADLPALYDIFTVAIGEVYARHGFEPPAPPPPAFAGQHAHLIGGAKDAVVVAEEAGAPVGFAAAWTRGEAWFLASLFVHPDAQARGLGRELLDAVWPASTAERRTITDAIQPRSNALYARRGLLPTTPVLSFGGAPQIEPPSALEPAEERPEDLARIDLAAYGFDRAVDHAYWARHAERSAWARSGEIVAWSYAFAGGTIGPVAGADPVAAADAVAAELARAAGRAVRVRAPGTSRRIVEVALAAGLRLAPTPGLLLLSDGVPPPTSLAIGSYTLF